jgi:hypothetical protein
MTQDEDIPQELRFQRYLNDPTLTPARPVSIRGRLTASMLGRDLTAKLLDAKVRLREEREDG